jgi:hypothetical protein
MNLYSECKLLGRNQDLSIKTKLDLTEKLMLYRNVSTGGGEPQYQFTLFLRAREEVKHNQPIRLPGLKPGVCSGLILSGAFYPDLKIGVWRRRTYQELKVTRCNFMKTEREEVKSDEKSHETEMVNSYLHCLSDSIVGDGSSQICRL